MEQKLSEAQTHRTILCCLQEDLINIETKVTTLRQELGRMGNLCVSPASVKRMSIKVMRLHKYMDELLLDMKQKESDSDIVLEETNSDRGMDGETLIFTVESPIAVEDSISTDTEDISTWSISGPCNLVQEVNKNVSTDVTSTTLEKTEDHVVNSSVSLTETANMDVAYTTIYIIEETEDLVVNPTVSLIENTNMDVACTISLTETTNRDVACTTLDMTGDPVVNSSVSLTETTNMSVGCTTLDMTEDPVVNSSVSLTENERVEQHQPSSIPKDHNCECPACKKTICSLSEKSDLSIVERKSYPCFVCGLLVSCVSQHVKDNHPDLKLLQCFKCGIKFDNLNQRINHMKSVHSLPKQFRCDICKEMFSNFINFGQHRKSHCKDNPGKQKKKRNPKQYQCQQCGKAYANVGHYKRHMMTHDVTKSKPIFTCSVCNKTFSKILSLTDHMNTHNGVKTQNCSLCLKSFFTKSSLSNHFRRMHSETYLMNKCPICGLVFNTEFARDTHCLTKHTEDERKHHNIVIAFVDCDVCGKSVRQGNFTYHMNLHSGPRVCDCCGKLCSSESALDSHKRTTSCGDRSGSRRARLVCTEPGCEKTFPSKFHLNMHINNNNSHNKVQNNDRSTQRSKHMCDVCGKLFANSLVLQEHQNKHKGIKPHQCKICGKCFTHISNLRRHRQIHTGRKFYNCHICDKALSTKSSLQVHLHIHTGDKPYACTQCGATFSDPSTRHKHQLRHAKTEQTENNAQFDFETHLLLSHKAQQHQC